LTQSVLSEPNNLKGSCMMGCNIIAGRIVEVKCASGENLSPSSGDSTRSQWSSDTLLICYRTRAP